MIVKSMFLAIALMAGAYSALAREESCGDICIRGCATITQDPGNFGECLGDCASRC